MIGRILKKTFSGKLNILTIPTHESAESNLAQTAHNFYALTFPPERNPYKLKSWDTKYRPLLPNYTLLKDKLPQDIQFDLVLSQHKFGQIQTLGPIAERLRIPLIQYEHTQPYKDWPESYILNLKQLRGNYNVFISEYSRDKWLWGPDEGLVIRHGLDSDLFCPGLGDKTNHLLSVCNDWVNRTLPCGFDTWQEVSKGFPVKVVGATPGFSEPAKSTSELVEFYQKSRVFLNTSRFSPIPMSLMEAASCECAIVTTHNPMIAELIENGKNGFISNCTKQLREYCQLLLNDEALALELGRNARKTILEKFSLKKFVDDWNDLFQRAVDSN